MSKLAETDGKLASRGRTVGGSRKKICGIRTVEKRQKPNAGDV